MSGLGVLSFTHTRYHTHTHYLRGGRRRARGDSRLRPEHWSSLSLSLSRARSLSLSRTHTHTHFLSSVISLSLFLSLSLTHTLSLSHTLSLTHTLSRTHTLAISISLSLSPTHTHTLSLSRSLWGGANSDVEGGVALQVRGVDRVHPPPEKYTRLRAL